ncbi:phage terminase large subunit, partial [Pseudomonas aeruginosa]|nr:phage terminase large subunit [Pseudomonas aeruginosa]
KIKSMEGIDVCWAEEAEAISDMSWDVLVPTIRKSGSEIWISFNPKFDDDATYVRFVSNPPANCIAIKMNWTDNKYISQELIDEKNDLKERDLDKYLWVWEGHCLKVLDGAVYMDEMRKMRDDGRISNVPYEPSKPVYTFWDLGFGDSTA